jgi:hypothetical protein
MQHDARRIGCGISGCRGDECGQTGIQPRQIADQMYRLPTQEVRKLYQGTRQRRPVADKRGDDDEEQ